MAITVLQAPNRHSVYNPIITTCSSSNIAQDNFSFIFEVYDSANFTQLAKVRIPPDIDYSFGVFDIAKVLESYLTYDFFMNVTGNEIRDAANSSYTYYVRIGESYEVAGVQTDFDNLTAITDTCFNWSLNNLDYVNFDLTNYVLDGATKKFLTNKPTYNVTLADSGFINLYNDTAPARFVIKTYDAAGSLIQTARITNNSISKIAMCPINPVSLNAATLTTGTQPLVTSSIATYTIAADNGSAISETLTFNLYGCDSVATIHFLNVLGGFDSFNFDFRVKKKFTSQKEFYKKNPKRLAADGSYNFSTIDREWEQYYTAETEEMTLTSDWITDNEAEWLREMYNSPVMFLTLAGNTFALKGLNETNYEVKEYEYDNLHNIEVTVQFGIDNYRQRA